ncbi:MAG: ATP-binding protein [Pseudomonadota bacterium]
MLRACVTVCAKSPPMTPQAIKFLRRAGIVAVPILALAASYLVSFQVFDAQERTAALARAGLFQRMLGDQLSRFEHLPSVLAEDPVVQAALATGADRSALNARFAEFARSAALDAIYLLDKDGLTIAASNHDQPLTFLGQNYGFRPYFRDALEGQTGRFFAIGATTSRPGYFIARPVSVRDVVAGVVVIKQDLQPMADGWAAGAENVLVENSKGVVVLASDPRWRYGALRALSTVERAAIADQRQFGAEKLPQLNWRLLNRGRVTLDASRALHLELPVGPLDWRLHYLAPVEPARARARQVAGLTAIVLALAIAAAVLLRSARLRAALAQSQAHQRGLLQANRALEDAQLELARNSRLAALGQLSASVTHELGQPITALQTYVAAAEMDPKPGDMPEFLADVDGIAKRMKATTDQLRFFAQPGEMRQEMVALGGLVDSAWGLTQPLGQDPVSLIVTGQAPPVRGNRHRLEQVLINLFKNARDSLSGQADARIEVTLSGDTQAQILVADNGPGLDGIDADQIFEPFQTTRPSGTGMGLGLSISSAIIREHGGQMSARPSSMGGLEVAITLPAEGDNA